MENQKEVEQKLDYVFKDKLLLATSFCHSSFANNHGLESNERLEFLGDSLLNFITTDFLYKNFDLNEGESSKIKAFLVSADNLSTAVDKLGIIKFLQCENSTVKKSKNVKCDLFEAILGAIYLDSDIKNVEKFINKNLNYTANNITKVMHEIVDYKTKFQEFVQQSGKNNIEYELIEKIGEAHEPLFKIRLKLNGKIMCEQTAKNKKMAENLCAKEALEKLCKE